MKRRLFGISLVILLVFVVALFLTRQKTVRVDLWGSATDPTQLALESVLLDVQEHFDPQLDLTIHYVANLKDDGTLESFQNQRTDAVTTAPEFQTFDLLENQRRLVLREYFPRAFPSYLRVRDYDPLNPQWEVSARAAGIKPDRIAKRVEKHGERLLKQESERLRDLRESIPQTARVLPFLFINGTRYEGPADFYGLSAAIVRPLLRGKRDALPESKEWSLFGGRITWKGRGSSTVRGMQECFADLHCQEKPDRDGTCVAAGTRDAHCRYTTPLTLPVTIVTPEGYDQTRDVALDNLRRNFKGLVVTEQARGSKEGGALGQEIERALHAFAKEAKTKAPDLPNTLPLYLFGLALQETQFFQNYVRSGAVIPLRNLGYVLNPSPPQQQ